MERPRRSLLQNFHDYFFPHAGNDYNPHFFSLASVAVIVLFVLVLEGFYFSDTGFLFKKTDFLAAVLPGVLVSLTNTDRAALNDASVTENAVLDQAATLAAEDMASKGYFAHVSPEGTTPWDWLGKVGYRYRYAGENLAVNFTDSSDVEKAWMASPTHHANIVKPQYTEVGIGVANGLYEGQEATFVVQFFAAPAPASVAQALAAPPPPPSAEAAVNTSVLAAQTAALPTPVIPLKPTLLTRTLASPTESVQDAVLIILALVAALFSLSILTRVHAPHPRVLASGAFLLIVASGALLLNLQSKIHVTLPTDSQSASVISAFQ
ncbi:hypothetical protein HY091_02865 [Candidatus Kaiserbacteria bacterium]|nr:hypothetical protein [Candidatus Kaiserbacteria bacterium]